MDFVVFSPPKSQNSSKYLHGGALVTLVDLAGAVAIPAAGFPLETGVSVEINVSCFDAAYVHVSVIQSLILLIIIFPVFLYCICMMKIS